MSPHPDSLKGRLASLSSPASLIEAIKALGIENNHWFAVSAGTYVSHQGAIVLETASLKTLIAIFTRWYSRTCYSHKVDPKTGQPFTRKALEQAVYQNKDPDFRGTGPLPGTRSILGFVPGLGTCTLPLQAMSEQELLSHLPTKFLDEPHQTPL